MTINATPIRAVWRKSTQRGVTFTHGRCESPWMLKLEGDTAKRRVYENWAAIDKRGSSNSKRWIVPLVIIVKGEVVTLSAADTAMVRATTS